MKLYEYVNQLDSGIYPQRNISCTNPKYWYSQGEVHIVRCGKCLSCLRKIKSEWALRILLEAQEFDSSFFITLTYSEFYNPGRLDKSHVQNFLKLLRSYLDYPIRFFCAGEFGTHATQRPHYHLCIFGLKKEDIKYINFCWRKGFSTFAPLNSARAQYLCGYTLKKYESGSLFSLMSRKPGIGFTYLFGNYKNIFNKGFIAVNGYKFPIPRAFFRKLKDYDESFYNEILCKYKAEASSSDMTAFLKRLEYKNLEFIKKRSIKDEL